jgi:hypothetical protein
MAQVMPGASTPKQRTQRRGIVDAAREQRAGDDRWVVSNDVICRPLGRESRELVDDRQIPRRGEVAQQIRCRPRRCVTDAVASGSLDCDCLPSAKAEIARRVRDT